MAGYALKFVEHFYIHIHTYTRRTDSYFENPRELCHAYIHVHTYLQTYTHTHSSTITALRILNVLIYIHIYIYIYTHISKSSSTPPLICKHIYVHEYTHIFRSLENSNDINVNDNNHNNDINANDNHDKISKGSPACQPGQSWIILHRRPGRAYHHWPWLESWPISCRSVCRPFQWWIISFLHFWPVSC